MNVFGNKFHAAYINLAVLFFSLLYLAVNYGVLLDLYQKWSVRDFTGTYSHGPLVAIIFLFIVGIKIWSLRNTLAIKPSLLGLIFLLSTQTLLFLAILADVNFLQHIMLTLSLWAIVWSVYSFAIAKQLILPIALFMMSFPVWGDLAIPLQKVAIFTTNFLLSFTGLPYYREHALFHFPNGIIEIAPECAGLQQLLVSLIIGILFSMQHNLRLTDIIKTLIYLSITAIFVNTIRIIIIMFVGYNTKMESTLITQHVWLGWVIYGIGIFIFLYFYSRLNFKSNVAIPRDHEHENISLNNRGYKYIFFVFVIVFLPASLVSFITFKVNERKDEPIHYKLTDTEWKKISNTISINWKPEYPTSDSIAVGEFNNHDKTVYLYINRYTKWKKDIEPANMTNRPYDPKAWTLNKHETIHVYNSDGGLNKLSIDRLSSRKNENLEVLTYYLINGQVTDSLVKTKLAVLTGLLRFKYDISVVSLAIKSQYTKTDVQSELVNFYKSLQIY